VNTHGFVTTALAARDVSRAAGMARGGVRRRRRDAATARRPCVM
jgi:hypothetical protein